MQQRKKEVMNKSQKWIKEYLLKYKFLFGILLLVIILGIIMDSISPYIYGKTIDSIIQKDITEVKVNLFIFFLISIVVHILTILETTIGKQLSMKIENELKINLYTLILSMKCREQDKYMEGELLNRLEFEVAAIIDYYIDLITGSLMIIFNFMLSLYFLIRISVKLTVTALFLLPISYIINFCFRKQLRCIQYMQKKFSDRYFGFLNECLGNLKGIKAFQAEVKYTKKYNELLFENFSIMLKNIKITNLMTFIRGIFNESFNIIILFISAVIILNGQMTIGNMVAFNTYLGKVFTAISKIMELNVQKQKLIVSFERIEELKAKAKENIEDDIVGKELKSIDTIEFNNVYFRYDVKNILNELNLKIDTKGLYSIVGKNGTGKSTLLKLLEKFYFCSEGIIRINSVDIREISTNQLRSQIAFLAKEPFMINDTIFNNLKIGNEDISTEEMIEACISVGLHRDIQTFKEGYNTILGEGGSHLSSGQKQKLGIARVLLRNTSLILLDEATSDLDGEVEKEICMLIRELSKDRIILNIGHRVEIVRQSDRVMVLDEGKIKADDVPMELEKKCSYYQKLFLAG